MKKFFKSVAVVFAALSLGLTSCSTEDPASPLTVNVDQTAEIQGTVLMRQNLKPNSKDKITFDAPQELNLRVTVAYKDLSGNSSASGNYVVSKDNISYNKNTGKYSIKVPVSQDGCDVKIGIADFYGTQNTQSTEDPDKYNEINGVWKYSAGEFTVSNVYPGDLKIETMKELTFTPGKEKDDEAN